MAESDTRIEMTIVRKVRRTEFLTEGDDLGFNVQPFGSSERGRPVNGYVDQACCSHQPS